MTIVVADLIYENTESFENEVTGGTNEKGFEENF